MSYKTSCLVLLCAGLLCAQTKEVKAIAVSGVTSAAIPVDKALAIQLAKADQTLVASKINPLLEEIKDLESRVKALASELVSDSTQKGQALVEEICKVIGLTPDDVKAGKCLLSNDMRTVSRRPDPEPAPKK